MNSKRIYKIAFAFVLTFIWTPGWAQNVLITPVGSHTGEFCRNDRALIFQDPAGLRILYDPGRTVMGGSDSRLGNIDVMLLSHVHVDHLGDAVTKAINAGTCASPDMSVSKLPNSNFAEIAAAKNAKVLVGIDMTSFLLKKIQAVNPASKATTQGLGFGGKFTFGGVTFATVAAKHSNGINPGFLTDPEKTDLAADGVTAYVGPEEGYVITFSNGLVVYLSGDTGIIADMDIVVRQYYGAELAVINMGDIFTMGPEDAAFAVNHLIKPKSVIPSHANEQATSNGVVLPGTKTQKFIDLVGVNKVHVPLSGVTMEFNSHAKCVSGC